MYDVISRAHLEALHTAASTSAWVEGVQVGALTAGLKSACSTHQVAGGCHGKGSEIDWRTSPIKPPIQTRDVGHLHKFECVGKLVLGFLFRTAGAGRSKLGTR
jgi:hypothetical protein